MSILIGKYEFDGPYNSVADLKDMQGLIAVLHCEGEAYELIHVAESHNVKECIELSESAYISSGGSVLLAALYAEKCGARERRAMVEDILSEFDNEVSLECEEPLSAATA